MTTNEETIAELKRQIWALDATVHNLQLQLDAVGAGGVQAISHQKPMVTSAGQADAAIKNAAPQQEVQEPVQQGKWAWVPVEPSFAMLVAAHHGQPCDFSARKVWQDMLDALLRSSDYTRPVEKPNAAPQPAPSIGAEVRKQDESLIRQMLEALEFEWGGEPLGSLTWGAITAARARLGEGGV